MRLTAWTLSGSIVGFVLAAVLVSLGVHALFSSPAEKSRNTVVAGDSATTATEVIAAQPAGPSVPTRIPASTQDVASSSPPSSPTVSSAAAPPANAVAMAAPEAAPVRDVVATAAEARPAQDIEPPGLAIDAGPSSKATGAYLDGLEALAAANWKQAADSFAAAIDAADSDVPDYYRARGVALALGEKLPEAISALQRASKLDPQSRETRVWLAAAIGMSGDFMKASEVYQSATLDPYETFVGQIRNDYGNLPFSVKNHNPDPRFGPQNAAAKQRFPQAGAWYASRMKNTPEMVQALLRRGKQRFAQGQFAAALDDLDYVRQQQPQDMAVQFFHAGCLLTTGDPATAWQEYTQILTQFTAFGQGYAYRAQADALLGDARRARADLAIAASLRPQDAAKFQAAVDQRLAALKAGAPREAPDALRADLEKSALGGAPLDRLVEQAVALRKAVQARRLNEDEVYQQRLKALEDALRAEPRNVDRLVALAEFLTREAKARYERYAPPEQFGLLRAEIPRDPEGEFARAERLVDEALAIDPNSAKALVAKARLCFEFYRFGDADELLQKALKIQRDVPDGLELWARVLTIGSNQAANNAVNLETPQSGSSTGYYSTIYWTRYPSAEDLRRAAEFREIARQRMQQAREIFEQAVKLRPSDANGYFDLATWRNSQGDLPGAQQALEKATQLDPKFLRAHQALAKVYRDQGLNDKALEEESLTINQTAGAVSDLLAKAYQEMAKTSLKNAAKLLAQAALADPLDARIPAYLAIVRLADEKPADGAAELRMAVALEEARLQPQGITGKNLGTGRLSPDDLALLMMLRIRLSTVEDRLGNHDEALRLAKDNLGLERRIPVGDMLRKVPTSVLPVVGAEPMNQRQPESAASLLAWSHLQAGVALANSNHLDEAGSQFQAGYMVGRALPNIVGMEPLVEPRYRCGLALVKVLYKKGDKQGAGQMLNKISGEGGSRELWEEAEQLRKAIFGPQGH